MREISKQFLLWLKRREKVPWHGCFSNRVEWKLLNFPLLSPIFFLILLSWRETLTWMQLLKGSSCWLMCDSSIIGHRASKEFIDGRIDIRNVNLFTHILNEIQSIINGCATHTQSYKAEGIESHEKSAALLSSFCQVLASFWFHWLACRPFVKKSTKKTIASYRYIPNWSQVLES